MAILHALQRRLTPKDSNGSNTEKYSEGGRTMPYDISSEYRRVIGDYLRDCRIASGLTQREVGLALNRGNTFISNYEVGRTSVPPEHYEALAKLFDLDPRNLATFLLRWTNPWLFLMLIEDDKKLRVQLGKLPPRKGL